MKTGEIVEILTSKDEGHGPSRDWLNIVKTSEARNKIRQWFKKEKREENIQEGRAQLERELKRNGMDMTDDLVKMMLEMVGRHKSCTTADDMFAAIGYGGIQLWKVMPRVREEWLRQRKAAAPAETAAQADSPEKVSATPPRPKKAASGVLIEGMDNCLVKFSRCCNPLPGDDIIGFITRGYGVSIHKRNCTNVPADLTQVPGTGTLGTRPVGKRCEGGLQVHLGNPRQRPVGPAGRCDPAAVRHAPVYPFPQFPGTGRRGGGDQRHHYRQRPRPFGTGDQPAEKCQERAFRAPQLKGAIV